MSPALFLLTAKTGIMLSYQRSEPVPSSSRTAPGSVVFADFVRARAISYCSSRSDGKIFHLLSCRYCDDSAATAGNVGQATRFVPCTERKAGTLKWPEQSKPVVVSVHFIECASSAGNHYSGMELRQIPVIKATSSIKTTPVVKIKILMGILLSPQYLHGY